MAQKLIYINKALSGDGGALEWLQAQSSDIPYTSSSNIYFHSLVFTSDNYLVTHGTIYNGHDTLVSTQALEDLGFLQSTGKINNTDLTVYAPSTTALPASIFAPTTGGTKGQFLISDGSTNAPLWANLKDILKNTTYSITTNDPTTTNCVLKYTSSGLTWSPDNNTTYKLTLNGTAKGGGSTDLGTFFAPTTAGTQYYILQSNGSGAPSWLQLTTSLSGITDESYKVPTSYAVKSYITDQIAAAVTQAMVYKGTVASHTNLPTGANVTNGDVYMFTGSGTYGSGANAKDYKAGDTAIARVSGSTVTWEIVPSGNEQETFITVTSGEDLTSATYNQATGEVKLGTAALKNYLADTSAIADFTTSANLVSAQQVVNYIAGLNYSTTLGTVTSVAAGTGLTTASGSAITNTGTIKAKLKSETSLGSISDSNKIYAVGVGDTNGYLAVKVPWTDTTHNFYVGGTGAKAYAAISQGTDIYLTTRLTSSTGNSTNVIGFKQGSGINIASDATGLLTITNVSRNVTTYFSMSAITSSPTGAKITFQEGTAAAVDYSIVGSGAASVAYDATNKKITITGTNTWRPVYAYNLQNQALGASSPAIAGTTGTAALAFGQEFAYTEGDSTINANNISEIHLAWAEVAADGTLSYAI